MATLDLIIIVLLCNIGGLIGCRMAKKNPEDDPHQIAFRSMFSGGLIGGITYFVICLANAFFFEIYESIFIVIALSFIVIPALFGFSAAISAFIYSRFFIN